MTVFTQKNINKAAKEAKAVWDEQLKASGKTQTEFITTDTTGFVIQFMEEYALIKEHVEDLGFNMPVIVKGVQVRVVDEDEE